MFSRPGLGSLLSVLCCIGTAQAVPAQSASTRQAALDPAVIQAALTQAGSCCPVLNTYLPGKVAAASDSRYTASLNSYWAVQEQSVRPSCILLPSSTQDVSTAVTILGIGYARSVPGCSFAVRSGGHTPFAGAANIQNGVTIDLKNLNARTVSGNRAIVSFGPGNRWGDVYAVLNPLGLIMVGGRDSSVGTGGLATGGGISYFSARYGYSCDNFASYEVVLGNGTVVTASSTSNPNLFKALKGGSNNFGIVTRFDAKLYPQSAFWGGSLQQPISSRTTYFNYMAKLTQSSTYDPFVALITSFVWTSGTAQFMTHFATYSNGAVTWPPPAFRELDAIPTTNAQNARTIRRANLTSFTDELNSRNTGINNRQNSFATLTVINNPSVSASFMAQAWTLANTAQSDLFFVFGSIFLMGLQPQPFVLYSKGGSGNVLGLNQGNSDLINVAFTMSWSLASDNARVYARMQKLQTDVAALARSMGILHPYQYLNYAAQWQQPMQSYGSANVAFMKSVSQAYDPGQIFQRAVPGGFKLPA